MKMSEKLKKKIYGDAQAIGLFIMSLGLNQKRQAGFFMQGGTASETVKRIMAIYEPLTAPYLAAKDYQKGYQALLDNTNLNELSYKPHVRKRFDTIENALSEKLIEALLDSYARVARAHIERERRERLKTRRQSSGRLGPAMIREVKTA